MNEDSPAFGLVSAIRAGWNLGNTLDALKRGVGPGEMVSPREAETAWHNPPVTRALIRAVRDAGFNAVRLPVTWLQHTDAWGRADPAWLDRVAEVTDWILDEGMICFLNVHHDAGAHGRLQATEASIEKSGEWFRALWSQIAARFADTGERLVFEAFNEMLDGEEHWGQAPGDEAYDVHLSWSRMFVEAVRAAGGCNSGRILSLQTYSAGHTPRTLQRFCMPEDTAPGRIILQVHNYDPQSFCWLKTKDGAVRSEWGTGGDMALCDSLFAALSAFSERHGAPVVIGEFGSEDKENDGDRERHAAYYTARGRERGIPCFWWDCGQFALLDRRTGRVLKPGIVRALTGI